ncbi:MAG: N-acetylmuramoyl-L-alanine amidase, partial [Pseudomonadota bacterium]
MSEKSVYLSPGHGWTYTSSSGWYTQRGNTLGLVEDLSNADGIDQFLVPYLLRAGALVVPVREIDPTINMVILDDSDGSQAPSRGQYVESGDPSVFSTSSSEGWGHPGFPLTGETNPFSLGNNRLMNTSVKETARTTYALNVPENGYYNVYISYSMFS